MSSGQRTERVVHQDYIARIRYSNALPPPPNPPKLLDIPGTGLAGGQYTSAGYASRLAREQPLNIEADAELGMPIDLIGIPGIFDGNESAISAKPGQTIHPADKALLKPLAALSKGATSAGGVSFLRRTEYVASQTPQHITNATSRDLLRLRADAKRRRSSLLHKDDPLNIIRNIIKGFDIAYPKDAYKGEESTTSIRGAAISEAEAKAWSNPKHPTNPQLQLLDSYPVLPDLDALPTTSYYMVTKFITNPSNISDHYDSRLDAGILRPVDDPQVQANYQRKLAEWDPNSSKPQPLPEFDYDFFIPTEASVVRNLKRKFDVNDPEKDDPALYTDQNASDEPVFRYKRVRTYETYNQHGDANNFYNDSIAMALHDPDDQVGVVSEETRRLTKAAYYYPVIQRTALRPKRAVGRLAGAGSQAEGHVDELLLTVADRVEEDQARHLEQRAKLDSTIQIEAPVEVEAAA